MMLEIKTLLHSQRYFSLAKIIIYPLSVFIIKSLPKTTKFSKEGGVDQKGTEAPSPEVNQFKNTQRQLFYLYKAPEADGKSITDIPEQALSLVQ